MPHPRFGDAGKGMIVRNAPVIRFVYVAALPAVREPVVHQLPLAPPPDELPPPELDELPLL